MAFINSYHTMVFGNLWIINSGVILGPYYLGIIRACEAILQVVNPLFQSFENIFPKF